LFIADTEDTVGAMFQEIQTSAVVRISDESPFETFLFVNLLLTFEDRVVEVVLKLLVGVVDATERKIERSERRKVTRVVQSCS
jgi:hypothetical protein